MPSSRTVLLIIAAISFALIGAALYLQHAHDMLPCPLCVLQRYAFLGIGIAALVGALSNKIRAGAVVALLAAAGGFWAVGKHLYVLANPGFSCGIDPMETMLNKIPTATLLPWLFQADGLCENATDGVLGLSIPQWSALWFVLLTLALVWVLVKQRRAR
ncbi:disulfide bond formation protein B [Massilia sp. Dwa41.01b]|uniref:disulfide bond formation protein B n=1 Tax=unclassified Massilia TaxID=2609279 RepID=UPI0016034737|nr:MULTISPECIES: disulfide bond formation protein B [unclassified Massilia]QNA90860.1 disulfide bond formation protein B [Massilia sp. Dwa41.01b]QNA98099.1 disulfide bond formation protein B [Massilia sp. Se16.2.3]